MTRFRDLPIRRKATVLILLASVIALALSGGVILTYDLTTVRPRARQDLQAQADLLEANAIAALRFGDRIAAREDLATLRAKPEISAAALYSADGRLFASYQRPARGHGARPIPDVKPDSGAWPGGPFVMVDRPMRADEEVLGRLAIWYTMPSLWSRLPQYGMIVGLVVVTLAMVSGLILGLLRTGLVRPLLALSHTAEAVATGQDYSLRATKVGNDEVGGLTDALNGMLGAIEERDAALNRSSRQLQDAMHALQRQAERLAEAMDAARMASYAWVPSTDELAWGDDERHILGQRAGTTRRLNDFLALVDPDDRDTLRQALEGAVNNVRPVEADFRLTSGGDEAAWFTIQGRSLLAEDGEARVVGLVQDVSERRRLEEQLLQSQKMEAIGRLAGGIAHDFNNLLTAINGYAGLVIRALPEDSPVIADIREIHRAGERAATLTSQLLAFSRRQVLQPTTLSLNEVLAGLVRLLGRLLGEDVRLHLDFEAEPGIVRADRGSLEQVIVNLAVNARDAMPSGGTLTMTTSARTVGLEDPDAPTELPPGEYVLLMIRDTGVGMAPDVLEHVFEPFYTTKEVGKGTGLGLAMVHGTIRQSGGGVTVDSALERGTTFTIYLPRASDSSGEAAGPILAPVMPGSETILLVEDDPSVLGLARRSLESHGYHVLAAGSADAAVRLLADGNGASLGKLDLLVTDVVMPEESGRELAEDLRARRPDLKVLYMSGHTDDAVVAHGVHEAKVAFLQKPFSAEALARKVRQVLDGPPIS